MNAPAPAAAPPDPLAGLRGLHLPEMVGAWPPAPGWWILALLMLASLIAGVLWIRRRRRSLATHALREFDALVARGPADQDLQTLATEIAALLRRVALARFGRRLVAHLHGPAWESFLEAHRRKRLEPEKGAEFTRTLALAPYAPSESFKRETLPERAALVAAARSWIRGIA